MSLYVRKYRTRTYGAPATFRVPTEAEWVAEIATWDTQDPDGAFGSVLKISLTGGRFESTGVIEFEGTDAGYWTSSINGTFAKYLGIFGGAVFIDASYRALGFPIRLIKDGIFSSHTPETITIEGLEYQTVYNPTTQRIWLDRNLGATQVATSSTDSASYGYLFQWGRSADGHEKRDSLIHDADVLGFATTEKANLGNDWDGKFIMTDPFNTTSLGDWLSPQNDNLWQGTDGINNLAPSTLKQKPILRNGKALQTYARGKYTIEEIDAMIADGYIPVATADELDGLRHSSLRVMGSGTIWAGLYNTGLDKKYVQVGDIDLSGFANWQQLGPSPANEILTLTYKGNELAISNLTITSGSQALFGTPWGAKFHDMRIYNADVSGTIENVAVLTGGQGGNSDINNITETHNIIIYNSKVNSSSPIGNIGGLIGISQNEFLSVSDCYVCDCEITGTSSVGGLIGETRSEINNCGVINTKVTGTGSSTGGFCGYNRKKISNSFAQQVTVINTGGSFGCGGFSGTAFNPAIFEKVWSSGTVTHSGSGANGCGGLVGVLRDSSIIDSHSHCNVTGVSNVGGGIGQHRDATSVRCYSTGAVTGTTAVGGYAGLLTGTNTITNSYYDTQTSVQSDTGKGEPRTTPQLQQAKQDEYILPAGGTDPNSLPDNLVYSGWDTNVWQFDPKNKYPRLK